MSSAIDRASALPAMPTAPNDHAPSFSDRSNYLASALVQIQRLFRVRLGIDDGFSQSNERAGRHCI